MKKKLLWTILSLIHLIAFCPRLGSAQTVEEMTVLKKEIADLKEGQARTQKEIEVLKSLLQGRRPSAWEPQNVFLTLEGDRFKGQRDAQVALIEFSDYQCPFCARHFSHTFPRIEDDYVKTGKVKYVFRDFPIQSIHPQAIKAHEAARCAGGQGKYWEMHDRLFANRNAQAPKDLSHHAKAIGIDQAEFDRCLDSGKYLLKVREDISEGEKAGVKGTPTFFLGVAEPNDLKMKPVRMIRGAHPYDVFKEAIESLLTPEKR